MRGHYAVGFRYRPHGDSAVRGAPTRTSHALLSSPYFLISTAFTTIDESASNPMTLGSTIIWLNMSWSSQTRSFLSVQPMKMKRATIR